MIKHLITTALGAVIICCDVTGGDAIKCHGGRNPTRQRARRARYRVRPRSLGRTSTDFRHTKTGRRATGVVGTRTNVASRNTSVASRKTTAVHRDTSVVNRTANVNVNRAANVNARPGGYVRLANY
jgi:hypothetical protein